MDTSEQYIKMCEKAEEIQSDHKYCDGDWVIYLRFKNPDLETSLRRKLLWSPEVWIYHTHEVGGGHLFDTLDNIECIWLPRQDQLQEMIRESDGADYLLALLRDLREFGQQNQTYNLPHATSMEQLWLSFVMEEKYNKVWDGKDWVNA